ncbi:hypothetical protein BGZ60DRAFT_351424, partial [Tricladium varicosporioides]
TLILLLYRSSISTHLQKIGLGTSVDEYTGLWNWGEGEGEEAGDEEGALRIVVLGDSWVADVDTQVEKEIGRGRSWARVLCEEINCTTFINFAATQPYDAYPASPPTGVLTSNKLQRDALASSQFASIEIPDMSLLPDFAAQVQQFIAEPLPTKPTETVFVLSLGFWDVYNYASLDFAWAQNRTDATVQELFSQLEILYTHYVQNLSVPVTVFDADGNETTVPSSFHVVIPKVLDPSLLPGWLQQRPLALKPSSTAEQQKNSVYLTSRWNQQLENGLGTWIKSKPLAANPTKFPNSKSGGDLPKGTGENNTAVEELPVVEKDAFYYDLAQYILDIIIEKQLQEEEISDASGLGKGTVVFDEVYEPCLHEAYDGEEKENSIDINGQLLCNDPEQHLFFDAFNIGAVAKSGIGKEIGKLVADGKSLRQIWSQMYGGSIG